MGFISLPECFHGPQVACGGGTGVKAISSPEIGGWASPVEATAS